MLVEHHGKEVKNPLCIRLKRGHKFIINLNENPRSPAELEIGKLREAAKNGLAMYFQTMPYIATNL